MHNRINVFNFEALTNNQSTHKWVDGPVLKTMARELANKFRGAFSKQHLKACPSTPPCR
jgi:hypothetical protein